MHGFAMHNRMIELFSDDDSVLIFKFRFCILFSMYFSFIRSIALEIPYVNFFKDNFFDAKIQIFNRNIDKQCKK